MAKQLALMTGGTGGPGEAISVKLYDAGYTPAVTHSPNNAGIESWIAQMAADDRQLHAYAVDVADYDSCQRCAQKIRNDVGPVDILVNNAGITRDASFKKLDKVNWGAVIRTNLDSVFNMTKPLCEGMVERGRGRIINVSSIIASKGGFGQTNYERPRPACMASQNRWRSKWRRKACRSIRIHRHYRNQDGDRCAPGNFQRQDHFADPGRPARAVRRGDGAGPLSVFS